MNAREVYELVKDVWEPDRLEYVKEGYASQMIRPHGWYFGKYPILPAQALDLIVGAMKREMGEAWYGCQWSQSQETWKAYIKERSDWPGYEADTEAEAVIAAWRAWKEAGK